MIAPKFKELSEKYLDVVFLKLDCNQENKVWHTVPNAFVFLFSVTPFKFLLYFQTLAKELGIRVVPTFKILKDGNIVKEVTGAKFDDLVFAIDTVKSSC